MHTLYDLEYGKKQWKSWKMRKMHCRTYIMARKLNNKEKWQTPIVGPGIWGGNRKHGKWDTHYRTWNMARNNEKLGKLDTHILGPEICREKWQMRKMRNSHGRTWIMARNPEKCPNWETHTVDEKQLKSWKMRKIHCRNWKMLKSCKMRNTHCRTWDMARKLTNEENVTHRL